MAASAELDLKAKADAEAKAKADAEAKAKADAEAKAKIEGEVREGKLNLLRSAAVVLEKVANLKAPLKAVEHPFDAHRRDYIAALKRVVGVLGRENHKGETPADMSEINETLHHTKARIEGALDKPYADLHAEVKAWLNSAK